MINDYPVDLIVTMEHSKEKIERIKKALQDIKQQAELARNKNNHSTYGAGVMHVIRLIEEILEEEI